MDSLVNVDVLHVLAHGVVDQGRRYVHRLERVRLHEDIVWLAVLKVHSAPRAHHYFLICLLDIVGLLVLNHALIASFCAIFIDNCTGSVLDRALQLDALRGVAVGRGYIAMMVKRCPLRSNKLSSHSLRPVVVQRFFLELTRRSLRLLRVLHRHLCV